MASHFYKAVISLFDKQGSLKSSNSLITSMTETPIYGINQNLSGSLQIKYLSYYLYILPSKSVYSQPGSPRHLIDIFFMKSFSRCCILLELIKRPTNKKIALAHLSHKHTDALIPAVPCQTFKYYIIYLLLIRWLFFLIKWALLTVFIISVFLLMMTVQMCMRGGGIMSLLNNNKVRFLLHINIIAKIRYLISFFAAV